MAAREGVDSSARQQPRGPSHAANAAQVLRPLWAGTRPLLRSQPALPSQRRGLTSLATLLTVTRVVGECRYSSRVSQLPRAWPARVYPKHPQLLAYTWWNRHPGFDLPLLLLIRTALPLRTVERPPRESDIALDLVLLRYTPYSFVWKRSKVSLASLPPSLIALYMALRGRRRGYQVMSDPTRD